MALQVLTLPYVPATSAIARGDKQCLVAHAQGVHTFAAYRGSMTLPSGLVYVYLHTCHSALPRAQFGAKSRSDTTCYPGVFPFCGSPFALLRIPRCVFGCQTSGQLIPRPCYAPSIRVHVQPFVGHIHGLAGLLERPRLTCMVRAWRCGIRL